MIAVSYTHLAKQDGFSDKYLSQILNVEENVIREERLANNINQAWEPVHVSGTKDSAYYYSTYNACLLYTSRCV